MSDKAQRINVIIDPVTHKLLRIESIEKKKTLSELINETLSNRFNKDTSNEK